MKSLLRTVVAVLIISIILAPSASAQVRTYYPYYIRAAYDVDPLLESGYTGKGVIVAVVNTGIDSTFYSDLKTFSGSYGLPPAIVSVAQPYGSAGTDKELPQAETTADAEFVHAMAPDAKILLVLVGSQGSILDGFSYVIDKNAADIAVLSPSLAYWGPNATSRVQSYNEEYGKSLDEKITLIAASNDWGSNNSVPWGGNVGDFWTDHLPNAYLMPQYSPYVTAVGGTVLTVQSGGAYDSETGWERSGGGPSNLFPEPSWQIGPGMPMNGFRNIPDVSFDASCDTAYSYYWKGAGSYFCGTSAGAPIFAGIIADIVQAAGERLGWLNPTLYYLGFSDPSVYHDVTTGCSIVRDGSITKTGYCAHPGWDFVTGWGSVDATKLSNRLAPRSHVTPVAEFPGTAPAIFILTLLGVPLIRLRTKRFD